MPRKRFADLPSKLSPEANGRVERRVKELLGEMPLHELRAAKQKTQAQLATVLGVNQAAISKMERRADMYVSTLRSYVSAMGGELDIVARFPEGEVVLTQFKDQDNDNDDNQPL